MFDPTKPIVATEQPWTPPPMTTTCACFGKDADMEENLKILCYIRNIALPDMPFFIPM